MYRAVVFSLFLAAAQAQPQASLYPDQSRISVCSSPGYGRARLHWRAPAALETQIRVGSAFGIPLTGWNTEPEGEAWTGDWVTDGMRFYLVNQAGDVLAATLITVRCGETHSSWLPLDVGNEWNYYFRSRQIGGAYSTMRVVASRIIGDQLWFNVEGGPFSGAILREDEEGRLWRYDEGQPMTPQLILDPTTALNRTAFYPSQPGPATYSSAGSIETLFVPFVQVAALDGRTGSFGKDTGMLELTAMVIAGSSGGFSYGYTLVRARVRGKVVFDSPETSLQLGVESQRLTLRPGLVTNCAVPCYFVACGLVPGADPPDTFKPCLRARLSFQSPTPADATVQLRLVDAFGTGLFHTNPSTATGGTTMFEQLPLYSAPNVPLPPGAYLLTGTADTPQGPLTSSIPIQILP